MSAGKKLAFVVLAFGLREVMKRNLIIILHRYIILIIIIITYLVKQKPFQ
jgi:hypothetical protein